MIRTMRSLTVIFILSIAQLAWGVEEGKAPNNESVFQNYTVRYAIFNSTFILPDVARAAGIKRSKYESLINVSVYKNGSPGSIAAKIQGSTKNLMQQLKSLDFKEIREKNATYYLAPIRVANEELMHFNLDVSPAESQETLNIKFSQKVYADE